MNYCVYANAVVGTVRAVKPTLFSSVYYNECGSLSSSRDMPNISDELLHVLALYCEAILVIQFNGTVVTLKLIE